MGVPFYCGFQGRSSIMHIELEYIMLKQILFSDKWVFSCARKHIIYMASTAISCDICDSCDSCDVTSYTPQCTWPCHVHSHTVTCVYKWGLRDAFHLHKYTLYAMYTLKVA